MSQFTMKAIGYTIQFVSFIVGVLLMPWLTALGTSYIQRPEILWLTVMLVDFVLIFVIFPKLLWKGYLMMIAPKTGGM